MGRCVGCVGVLKAGVNKCWKVGLRMRYVGRVRCDLRGPRWMGSVRRGVVCCTHGTLDRWSMWIDVWAAWIDEVCTGMRLVYVDGCAFFSSMHGLCVLVVLLPILRGSLRV